MKRIKENDISYKRTPIRLTADSSTETDGGSRIFICKDMRHRETKKR